ncbi:2-C-methyl-D-erythritol 2,4-cyclodiphosphate synthase [bacterium]|nr:2-C-methyl-D-erythritol 2,4-cyclodiphosphate synthase [bacterium]
MKIGIGYDIHRLVSGRALFLGGLRIPFDKGLLGHSDGDALIHAISDALLGAAGAGDIGQHFPDTDPKYKDISSLLILKKVADTIIDKGYKIVNIDVTVIAEAPKLSEYIPEMRNTIANTLGFDRSKINIKATTNEGLGEVGKGEAIAVFAVALIDTN